MGIRPILQFPHPLLSKPCGTVSPTHPKTKEIIQTLVETMNSSPGVGLAAPQIGICQRISVIDTRRKGGSKKHADKSGCFYILINPILLSGTGIQVPREGCLSVPDLLADVRRYQAVKVRTQTPEGREKLIMASGFEALALQHEIDHLDGKLFLDRILDLKTNVFRRKRK